jgi:hypothetical protein
MGALTIAEAKNYVQDQLVQGVAEDIITVNPIFSVFPYIGYDGHGVVVNRELTLGAAGLYDVNAEITDRDASTVEQITFTATKIIGDADIDNLIAAQSASSGVDHAAIEISSKAKKIGRIFQLGIATGTGVSPAINSLHSMCSAEQYTTASDGQGISFALLDELLDLVKSKDGQVDWIMMPPRTFRKYKTLLRALGGTPAEWVITLPDGRTTIGYEDIPIFKNEYLPVTETANGAALTGGSLTSVWAGVWDDGSMKTGLAAIHPSSVPAGISVSEIGENTDKDSDTYRVKQYVNTALFNRRGIARLTSIND